MTTQEFLNQLEGHPQKPLVFEYGGGKTVAPGYHVTEVMNLTYETVDCGGQANFWRETVVQLQGPGSKDEPEFMRTDKFLGIYHRVAASVPVRPDSEMRLEYGDSETPAVHYHVGSVETEGEAVIVRLSPPGVTCKAADRRAGASSCCGPSLKPEPIELEVVSTSGKAGCCD